MTEPSDLAHWQIGQVRSSLELLAAEPGRQAQHLERLGAGQLLDELALEFDDARPLVPGLIDRRMLPPSMEAAVAKIEDRLRQLGTDSNMWSEAALTSTPWQELRALASEALLLLPDADSGR